jgi:hypothetical protein
MRLLWGALQPPGGYYSYFLHLWSEATGELSAPINGLQPAGEHRPTLTWTRPDELLVGPAQTWTLPADLPAGAYALWLGVYDPMQGTRLHLPDGGPVYVLDMLDVAAC